MQISVSIVTVEQKFVQGTIGGNWSIVASPADTPGDILMEYVGPAPSTTFDLPENEAVIFRASRLDAAEQILGPVVTANYTVGEDLVPIAVAQAMQISASPTARAASASKGKK